MIDKLEPLIDAHTLYRVVEALAEIAGAKAAHVREAWQDDALAAKWEKVRRALERLLPKLPEGL